MRGDSVRVCKRKQEVERSEDSSTGQIEGECDSEKKK
jgi:hypothetical protein